MTDVDDIISVGSRKKRPKKKRPFAIECRHNPDRVCCGFKNEWTIWGRYKTEAVRDRVLAQRLRKLPHWQWRKVP